MEGEERLRRVIEKAEKEREEFEMKVGVLGKENERLAVLIESMENEKRTRSKSLQMALVITDNIG